MQKWKKILLGDYPHRRITAVILFLSVVIMCLVIRNDLPELKETDVLIDSTGQRESVTEDEMLYAEVEESKTAEEPVMEENGGEKVPEITPAPEEAADVEPQEPVIPEVTPEPKPVPDASRTPEPTQTPEVTPIPEVIPTPEPTTVPERTPISEPEEKEPEPEPEATSTPHEHSWMFDSWYQEPTCSNGGLVMEICAHCGETQVTGGIPTGEHSYQVETTGDCISEEVVVCSVCNCREVREKNPGNHIDVEDGFCYGCGKKTK